jgi:hypothetical protein
VARLKIPDGPDLPSSSEPLNQAEATRQAKAHPRAQAAYQRLANYVERTYGRGYAALDPRVVLRKDDFEHHRLFVEWSDIWSSLRSALMARR